MNIKLLSNGKGIITPHVSEKVLNLLHITFENAVEGMTVVFVKNNKDTLYRGITNNAVDVPRFFLNGKIDITVSMLNGKANAQSYRCDPIECMLLETNEIYVRPADVDTDAEVRALRLENEDLRHALKEQDERLKNLESQIAKMTEGYDII